MRSGRRFVASVAGAALATLGWGSPLHAQVSGPSAFSETYGNWTVRCAVEQTQEGESVRQCAMEQRFVWQDDDSGQRRPLLTVVLTPSPADGGMDAVVLAPFGLLFEPGLRLRADDDPDAARLEFHTCFPDGCVARGSLDRDVIDGFWTGEVLHVEAEPAGGGDSFHLEGSLAGFADASKRLLQETENR